MNSAQLAGGGGVHTRRTRGTMTWNNAVRTRGVLTHRDVFLKPACVERGLVRTGPNPDAKPGTPKLGDTKLGGQVWCARDRTPTSKLVTPKLGGTKLESQVWCALVSGQDMR